MKLSERMNKVIEELKATDINGCITGSALMDADFDTWDSQPDIDVFVYSPESQIHAVDILEYKLGFVPGKTEGKASKGEAWKLNRIRTKGMQKNAALSTVSMIKDGVVVNVTYRNHETKMVDVLSVFDMSIIMKGWDIPSGYELDLRGPDTKVATPNKLRKVDGSLWNTEQWVRQFDRVIKYWNRGFDTRPMARFYIDLIDETLETGALFDTDKSKDMFDQFAAEFIEVRNKIASWLEDKED